MKEPHIVTELARQALVIEDYYGRPSSGTG
jgi:hypothetical protein